MDGLQNVTPKKRAFLLAYVECGQLFKAALCAKINRQTHYHWLRDDPEYVNLFEQAKREMGEMLESEAIRRANEGVVEPIVYQGNFTYPLDENGKQDRTKEPLGIRKYSDTLLIFLLKGAIPEKYKERHEHTGPNGETVVARLELNYVGKSNIEI